MYACIIVCSLPRQLVLVFISIISRDLCADVQVVVLVDNVIVVLNVYNYMLLN